MQKDCKCGHKAGFAGRESEKKLKIFLKKLRKTPCNFHVYLI